MARIARSVRGSGGMPPSCPDADQFTRNCDLGDRDEGEGSRVPPLYVKPCLEERGGHREPLTLSTSMSLLMTSLTRFGRSSAHWQYSTIIFTSSGTMLKRKSRDEDNCSDSLTHITHPKTAKL